MINTRKVKVDFQLYGWDNQREQCRALEEVRSLRQIPGKEKITLSLAEKHPDGDVYKRDKPWSLNLRKGV